MIDRGLVKIFGDLVLEVEAQILEDINRGKIETEPSTTDRFIQALEDKFPYYYKDGSIVFEARSVGDRGRGASESKYGTDFVGVLNIDIGKYQLTKGFIAQAKNCSDDIKFNKKYRQKITIDFTTGNKKFNELKEQTGKMLSISPDSFVFIYCLEGIYVVPASSVDSLKINDSLYAKPVSNFFKEFLMCFIGDQRLNAWDDGSLDRLRIENNAKNAILFKIRTKNEYESNPNFNTVNIINILQQSQINPPKIII